MPYNLQIITGHDFLRLDPQRQMDLERSREALAEIAQASKTVGIDRAMIDLREIRSHLSTNDIYPLASAYSQIGLRSTFRLALLHGFSGGESADLFAMFASIRGGNVRSFDNFEDEFEWRRNVEG